MKRLDLRRLITGFPAWAGWLAVGLVAWGLAIGVLGGGFTIRSLSQVLPPPVPVVHTCRAQIAPYSSQPAFAAEFDFIDRTLSHLPVVTQRQRPDQTRPEIFVWDALYGSDGDYDYWTTPVLREYTLEKTEPLVIVRQSTRGSYPNTAAKLNATLSVNFRRKQFPVSCTVAVPGASSGANSGLAAGSIVQIHQCQTQIKPGTRPLFDLEFDYLSQSTLQQRYPYPEENLYVKVTDRFPPHPGQVRQLEARWGSDGDYSFWTTPVLRDVSGGTSPIVIDLEPGVLVRPGSPSLSAQLSSALSASFAGKSYPVKCL
jgi:hypothetical protein